MSENYLNPNFNSQYQQNGNYNLPSKGLETIKNQDNAVGKVAERIDPETGYFQDMVKLGLIYGTPMSIAFIHGTNWLMKPKNLDGLTQLQAYKNSRMYKMGAWLDNSALGRWINRISQSTGKKLAKIPVPKPLKDLWGKIKIGTVSTWDGSGMYTQGKKAEAMQEAMDFFKEAILNEEKKGSGKVVKVLSGQVKKLGLSKGKEKQLINLLKRFKDGKIDQIAGFAELDKIISGVSAKKLNAISIPVKTWRRACGMTKDLNTSISKARFFAGMNASGPFGKFFNKITSLVGEASGGAVLGGTQALVGNAIGLGSAFVAAKRAEKGDKFKAFMEDYMGFTIGSYLGMMFEGWALHKALGAAEHGMNLNACKGAAKALGLENPKRVQDLVIEFNKQFKQNRSVNEILDKLAQNKSVSLKKINKILEAAGKTPVTNINAGKKALVQIVGKKNTAYFNNLRTQIANATKSSTNITFRSIFNGQKGTMNRFLEWFTKKPLASIGKLFATGKYTLLKNGSRTGNFLRMLKRNGGGIARIFLVAAILIKPISNGMMKLSHLIFGKPKNSQLDEDKKNNEDSKTPQNNPEQQQQNTPSQPQINNGAQQRPSQNLVDLYMQNIPKKEVVPVNPNALKSDTATYMPNQILGQESYIDPAVTKDLLTRRDLALSRADAAERNARELLSRI